MCEMFVTSLRNRIRAMNTLWERVVVDMSLEQVNHQERSGVLPIAFSLSHFVRAQDLAISGPFLREPPVWEAGGWAQKVGVTVDRLGREESVEEMECIRFADFDAWCSYQSAVIARTNASSTRSPKMSLARWLRRSFRKTCSRPSVRSSSARAAVRKLDVLECFVFQHGLRHMGEIEHGRALVGLKGMTS